MIPDDVVRRRVTVPATGTEIALQDWGGDGPLALLHHANGFCAALWAPVAERLRDRFRVVAMDARGAGASPAPAGRPAPGAAGTAEAADPYAWRGMMHDVAGVARVLLEETGRTRIALGVGHSFGGTLVMAAEGALPGLFERIVAVDPVIPTAAPVAPEAGPAPGELLAERARKRRSVWPSRVEARAHFAGRALFHDWTERALDLYVAEGLRERPDGSVELKCSPEAEAGVFAGSHGFDVLGALSGLRPPVLLLWARRGSFARTAYEQLAAGMADARIEDVDSGHLVPMEAPEVVVDAIDRFCART